MTRKCSKCLHAENDSVGVYCTKLRLRVEADMVCENFKSHLKLVRAGVKPKPEPATVTRLEQRRADFLAFMQECVNSVLIDPNVDVDDYHVTVTIHTPAGEVQTGYFNCNLQDKLRAKEEINFDAIDQFLLSNKGRYT